MLGAVLETSTGVDDVVVMLDAQQAFAGLPDTDLDIYWGAYVGTPDEVLVHGDLQRVKGDIQRLWAEHRARKGWNVRDFNRQWSVSLQHELRPASRVPRARRG